MKKIFLILVILFLPIFSQAALININTASQEDLDEFITGVGVVIAGRIIEYRNLNGSFKTIEELKNVKGIGDATFLKMKDQVTVGTSSSDQGLTIANDDSLNLTDLSKNLSVHTSDLDLDDYQKENFKVSAGRERLATIKTPVIFTATASKRGENTTSFMWNFGDGTSAYGERVSHAYHFAGRYNVILNANIDQKEEAIARTLVVVTEAQIKITNLDFSLGFIELTNYSDQEQNLNQWSLKAGDKTYIFPLDTIISPRSDLKISLKLIGLDDQSVENVTLNYPDGSPISGAQKGNQTSVQDKIISLQKDITSLKNQQTIASSKINLPEASPRAEERLTGKDGKNVVILAKEPSWFEKIKNAIFK